MICELALFVASSVPAPPSRAPVDAITADRTRIQGHLGRVLSELRARDVSALQPPARAKRARLVQALEAYREAGRFPHNINHPGQQVPYFIDHLDTACAVGHLMIVSGADDLARTIAARENNARVFDITTPGVAAWLDENGLTIEEAARIQPSYCNCPNDDAPVCGVDGMTYQNECVATMCAGVAVDHTGACTSASTGSDWPGTGTGSTTDDTESTGDDGGKRDDKGCHAAGSSGEPWSLLAPLLGLGLARRRRG